MSRMLGKRLEDVVEREPVEDVEAQVTVSGPLSRQVTLELMDKLSKDKSITKVSQESFTDPDVLITYLAEYVRGRKHTDNPLNIYVYNDESVSERMIFESMAIMTLAKENNEDVMIVNADEVLGNERLSITYESDEDRDVVQDVLRTAAEAFDAVMVTNTRHLKLIMGKR